MKLIETPVTQIRAGDKIDLHTEQSGFYTVLNVRAMASNLLAYPYPSDDDQSIELLVQRSPLPMLTFEPKYVYRAAHETLARAEATES